MKSAPLATASDAAPKAPNARQVDAPTRSTLDGRLIGAIKSAFLHQLSQHERLLVILRYVERMSTPEIALTLDLTEEQVGLMHDTVLGKLARHLGGAG